MTERSHSYSPHVSSLTNYDKKESLISPYVSSLTNYDREKYTRSMTIRIYIFFRKCPFSGWDDRVKTSARALVFTRCDIQSERL